MRSAFRGRVLQWVLCAMTLTVAVVGLILTEGPGGASGSPSRSDRAAAAVAAAGDVTPATCGAGSLPETALQGEVPLKDQVDGRALQGYACNTALVGESPVTTTTHAFIMSAFVGDCAYLSTVNGNLADSGLGSTGLHTVLRGGVEVQNFSDPSKPVEVQELSSPALVNPWESLKANIPRGLLGAVGIQDPSFDLYSVPANDCSHPVLDASINLPQGYGHAGSFSPDGRFYYATDPPSLTGATPDPERVQIIDVSDPQHPRLVLSWVPPTPMYVHDVAISPDGNRAYFAINGVGQASTGKDPTGAGQNGLLVMNTSQVEAGVPNPQISIIGQVHWNADTGANQAPELATINHKPYVVVTDEGGNEDNLTATSCPLTDPYGYPRIISLADESEPTIVGTLRLQAQDPANCSTVLGDHATYSSHYCTVDNPQNATAIACTYWDSGLRVFDIRDPAHPREIAYYNPPWDASAVNDLSLSNVRWDTSTNQIWFSNELHGVQIIKLTNNVYPLPALKTPANPAPVKPVAPTPARLNVHARLLHESGRTVTVRIRAFRTATAGLHVTVLNAAKRAVASRTLNAARDRLYTLALRAKTALASGRYTVTVTAAGHRSISFRFTVRQRQRAPRR